MRSAANTSALVEIPGYTIERLIGRGGTASVYLGIQRSLGRRVALKVLKRFDNAAQANRFLHEGRIIAALNHRNIITIHDIGSVGERHYIAMEYLRGRSLAERIATGVPLPKALSLLEQLAACLHFVHKRGIVHRDIKPSNIMFHADGTPKLTDFGIAERIDSRQQPKLPATTLGTPYYLSPEQAEGLPIDGRADIYALGLVFYEMLTGQRPYAKDSPLETVLAHLTAPLPKLPAHLADYQGLLDNMLAKQPGERVGSAKELVYLVRQAKAQKVDGPPVTRSAPREPGYVRPRYRLNLRGPQVARRRTKPWFTLAVAVIAFAALLMIGALTGPDTERTPGTKSAIQATDPILTSIAQQAPSRSGGSTATQPVREASASRITEPPDDGRMPSTEALAVTAASTGEIAQLVLAANEAMDALRLTQPHDDNAVLYFRKVLALRPDHAAAKAGIATIAQRYADMAERAMERGETRTAATYVRRGLGVAPEQSVLLRLQQTIAARQREAAAVSMLNDAPDPATMPLRSPAPDGIAGTPGTGEVAGDFKRGLNPVVD
jgi:serine/threonine protein kinase